MCSCVRTLRELRAASRRVRRESAQLPLRMLTSPRRYTTCAKGISEGCPSTGRTSAFAMVVRWVERGHFIHAPEVPKNRREPSSRKVGNHASPIRWGFISGHSLIHSSIHASIHADSSSLSIVGGGKSEHLSLRQDLRSRERGVIGMSRMGDHVTPGRELSDNVGSAETPRSYSKKDEARAMTVSSFSH